VSDERARELRERLLEAALQLPGAYEDHPWDDTVTKVGKKIFAFFGQEDDGDDGDGAGRAVTIAVKLLDSHEEALAQPGATPTGYGLGRAGWVTLRLDGDAPPYEVIADWLEESYRRVAPRRLVAELDSYTADPPVRRAGGPRHRGPGAGGGEGHPRGAR
jgi:predicted DNA-binding protein (MmcQ/YjbR family)